MKKSEIKRNEIRKEFALNTTCHGLSQVYQTDNRWMKLSWIAVVLTVFVILIWQVSKVKSPVNGMKFMYQSLVSEPDTSHKLFSSIQFSKFKLNKLANCDRVTEGESIKGTSNLICHFFHYSQLMLVPTFSVLVRIKLVEKIMLKCLSLLDAAAKSF